jgi:hypothetical protein
MGIAIPYLQKLQKEGASGQKKSLKSPDGLLLQSVWFNLPHI